jgi:diamine N-acetyltransferase
LKADTFRESFAGGNDPTELAAHIERAFSVDVVAAQLADPDSDTTWILHGSEPVGYLKLNRGRAQTEPGLEAGEQRRGQARLVRVHVACVWEQNHNAISLYRHRGFQVFDKHVFMFGAEPQTDLLMRLALA